MKKLLFVVHNLDYTGSPRSTLRMCKVAKELGYSVIVWSAKEGLFADEFNRFGIKVDVVEPQEVKQKKYIEQIKKYDMAICNTILTAEYYRILCRYIPSVLYIRESENLHFYTRANPYLSYILKHCSDIYCVSEYAADIIKEYTKKRINIIHNCVEDEESIVTKHTSGRDVVLKVAQFGTLIYRKGFDVLLDAYELMPKELSKLMEIYIAGESTQSPYSSEILKRINNNTNVHYLGVLRGNDKTITLSEMDVVVVASRDESCSLVALEGAMLSKPLIVTENVGAKYVVTPENGLIVNSGDANGLRKALEYMIKNRKELAKMGHKSRELYEKLGNMDIYRENMMRLFQECDNKNKIRFKVKRLHNRILMSYSVIRMMHKIELLVTSNRI